MSKQEIYKDKNKRSTRKKASKDHKKIYKIKNQSALRSKSIGTAGLQDLKAKEANLKITELTTQNPFTSQCVLFSYRLHFMSEVEGFSGALIFATHIVIFHHPAVFREWRNMLAVML